MLTSKLVIKMIILFIVLLIVTSIIVYKENNHGVNHRLQWWLNAVDWDREREDITGKGVSIAILDTGIDFSHDDLQSCNHEEDNIIGSTNGKLDHGTAIAGIIAAYPKGKNGVLGIAPDVKIISMDITNEDNVEVDNLIRGIEEAIKRKVDIINISVGIKENNANLHSCIQRAYKNDIVIIASSGNYVDDKILYPAAYDEVIAVGSYNKKGKNMSPKKKVEGVVYLPGESIVTCVPGSKYTGVQGTSFSTAIMSGIVALVKEKKPDITMEKIYSGINTISTLNSNEITVKKILEIMEGK